MALFGIGKKDEEEYDEEYEAELEDEKRQDRKLTRKFKDLSPENKKKRKEPVKPWGKKERLIVLMALLATVAISAVLALSARGFSLPSLPKLSFDIKNFKLVSPFGEDKIILGGKKEIPDTKGEDMIRAFTDKVKSLSGTYSFYVVELNSGKEIGIGENEKMTAASLIKLPIFITLYKEAEVGNIDLDAKYTLKNSDKRTGSGSLYGKPAGTVLAYRDLARLMGKESDNTAFNILKNVLGEEKINAVIGEIGMTNTSIKENTTSPKDVGIFFQKLWNGLLVNEDRKNEILGYLTDTIYENWIVMGIPSEVPVAHKYGREVHVVNDAGVVMTENPFVLVLMSQGIVEDQADNVFPDLARTIYEFEK